MSEDVERELSVALQGIAGISKVGGGPVPLPSPTGVMSDHLFVNLTLSGFARVGNPADELSCLRDLAWSVLERIQSGVSMAGFTSTCVSFFIPISNDRGLRIYRTRVLTENLPRLNRANLSELVTGEESGSEEIRNNITGDSHFQKKVEP